jgi:hypothetical protein
MRTVQRLYLYSVTFISLEVVIWGLIGLARFAVGGGLVGSGASQLASAISLIAVGVPVFWLHWWLSQRKNQDPVERFSWLRGVFLYGVLLATLIPVAQNVLAFLNRISLRIFGISERMAFLGEGQSWIDNGIAVLMNGLMALYFYSVLRQDWAVMGQSDSERVETLPGVRRLYRYIWVIYGLAMVTGGVQQVLSTVFNTTGVVGMAPAASLANGLSLLFVGTPLWVYTWRTVQLSLHDQVESQAALRMLILFILSLAGIGGVLVPAGMVIQVILSAILGETNTMAGYLAQMSPLATLIPFAGVWFYYERIRKNEVSALGDENRKAGLQRLYHYILSFVGLVATLIGLHALLSFVVDSFLPAVQSTTVLRERLSMALSTLVIGLPLWVLAWRPMIAEAAQEGEAGDHARRSLVRKIYLYLALFSGVIGGMSSAGALIFQFLSKLFGDTPENYQRAVWMLLVTLLVFTLLLAYHWATLRADGHRAEKSISARHAAFSALVLVTETGEFVETMLKALQDEMPALPVVVHHVDQGIPDEALSEARVVILPGELAAHPAEAIRIWLQGFKGVRLVVPSPAEGWLWIFGSGRSLASLTRQTARLTRHLAEGEALPKYRETSAWLVALYILAGLVAIPVLISLLSALGQLWV